MTSIFEGQSPQKTRALSNQNKGAPFGFQVSSQRAPTFSPPYPDPDLGAPTLENFVPFAQDLVPFNHIELY